MMQRLWIPAVLSLSLLGFACKNKSPEAPTDNAPQAAPQAPPAAPAAAAVPAPAPAAPAAAAQASGPRVEGEGFVVQVTPPADAKVGTPAVAELHLTPKTGFHVNKDYPISLAIQAPDGVTVDKPQQTAKDAAHLGEDAAQFQVKFTPKKAGAEHFAATFKFAVCTPNSCDPQHTQLAWNVEAK